MVSMSYLMFVSLFFAASCGDFVANRSKSPSYGPEILLENGPQLPNVKSDFFMFTGVDSQFQHSTLYQYDLKERKLSRVLGGQSGDPVLFGLKGSSFLLFNRKIDLNFTYFSFDIKSRNWIYQGQEPLINNAKSVVEIGAEHLLVADYNGEGIIVYDLKNHKIHKQYGAEFFGKMHLKFIELIKNGNELYALTEGFDANFQPNASQTLYRLSIEELDLKYIESYKLPMTSPRLVFRSKSEFDLVGMCYAGQSGCTQGFASFSIAAHSFVEHFEFDSGPFVLAGSIVGGIGKKHFYADVEEVGGRKNRSIQKFEISSQNSLRASLVHSFENRHGIHMMATSTADKLLVIGEQGKSSHHLHFYSPDQSMSIESPQMPYQGIFLPDSTSKQVW